MPSPINFVFTNLVAGGVANASDLTAAFELINTYLTDGIPTTDLAKPKNLVSVTVEFNDSIGAGGYEVRGFKVPASTELAHVETAIFRGSPSGKMDVTLHDNYAEASTAFADVKVGTALNPLTIASADAAGTIDTSNEAYTFTAGTSIFIRVAATTAPVYNANVTMWFKTTHVA